MHPCAVMVIHIQSEQDTYESDIDLLTPGTWAQVHILTRYNTLKSLSCGLRLPMILILLGNTYPRKNTIPHHTTP